MGLTDQQRAAARSNRSVVVTAGAGTGKTHLLAERYLYHLESGYSPLEIVALTFTEKAAAELRSRIRQTIRERSPHEDWIAELEAAQISTFHALAARICREHPDAAGVSPDFTVLDEVEGKVWQAEALAHALDQIPLPLYEQVPYSLMRDTISTLISDPLTAAQALEKSQIDWLPEAQRVQKHALHQLIHHQDWADAKATLNTYAAPGDKLDLVRESALAAIAHLEQGQQFKESLNTLCSLKVNVGGQKAWGGKTPLETVKDAIKRLRTLADDAQKSGLITLAANAWDTQTEAILPALREAFTFVRSQLEQLKQRQRLLDFNDLEAYALKALQNQSVRDYYAQRWQAFLIDEFQDTNPTQGELLESLTADKLLTLVGDVKQSIYGFRRADVRVFQAWCDRIHSPDNPPKALSLSFRTHHQLVQSVNTLFAPILNELHQNLEAHRQTEPHPAPHLRVFTIQNTNRANLDQCRQTEAHHIAALIKEMLDQPVQVQDPASGQLRPINFKDIAILTRAWSPLELYGQALESQGIPILQMGGGSLLETREAKDAWALLRFLADPTDDIALMAVLRSPFCAMSDRLLFQLAQTLPEKTYWWKHLKHQAPAEVTPKVQVLEQLLLERRTESPVRLLQLADRLTGYTAVLANLPNAPRRAADWQGFLDFVGELAQGTGDVLSVVRRLRQLAKAGVEVPRPALEAGNAVSLMTIHASKGLEWPLVVVADLVRRSPIDSPPVRFDPDLGVALKFTDDTDQPQKSALYRLLSHRKRQQEQEEAKRVLYVALTRARDHLILTAADSKGGGLDILKPGLSNWSIQEIPLESYPCHPIAVSEPDLPISPTTILTHSAGSGLWELPVTALTDYVLCPQRFTYRYVQGHPGFYDGDGCYGTEIGTVTHWALQHQVQQRQTLQAMFPALPEAVLQEALDLAHQFHQHKAYTPYRNRPGQAEYPVTLTVGSITFNGFIDWLTPDFVLDFKTDTKRQPQHHRLQLWAYARASDRSTAHIAYLRHGSIHTFTTADLDALDAEAMTVAQAIAAGYDTPQPSLETCAICPYLEICDRGVRVS